MTAAENDINLKAGRRRVARSRGALSGILLIILGAWAALIPFIGPWFNFGFNPSPDDSFHWTSGRGLYELLPGAVAVFAGLILLLSASRALTLFAAWLGVVAGAWLVVVPALAQHIGVAIGSPDADPTSLKADVQGLLYFWAIGAAVIFVAAVALGRLSTHSVRDVRAAERRAEAEAEAARVEGERRAALEAEERRRRDEDDRRLRDEDDRRLRDDDDRRLRDDDRRDDRDDDGHRHGLLHRNHDRDHDGRDDRREDVRDDRRDDVRDGDAGRGQDYPPPGQAREHGYGQQPSQGYPPRDAAGSSAYSGHHSADPNAQAQPAVDPNTGRPIEQDPYRDRPNG
ncbi:hypothetical protein SAMN05443575_1814 [Jatrophihabitans endophyticus]|uniref:Uncharacterized protein n=1 Tax=Jatrophihabitans endophyticus TaxID=1206085 RepID=A0A1M5IAT9_9ACTN|nr:hypothetical protein [Jatrophihabitans endophyticus]SHG25010.1 hypothetical protein SAMN05443575_1814 [Jatrophihabitans endophyticus]